MPCNTKRKIKTGEEIEEGYKGRKDAQINSINSPQMTAEVHARSREG